ncbi:hypothetical protein DAC20_171 [Bacteroides phage DAC20]|nr:hypothetical protein DAC16_166 [Bacteroides phage DAC16]QIG63660.1 hypothetical protein DAC19_172 [Bacteroides phage DAC19]QIG63921.1 hypothetical protein DAC20_171 [Bacteroides phage DAC20]QIG64185.1 hypothetical protein DAC22_174 [Bacteroides phage DAC22]QIG64441.1 hypothetical protein DAC23_166 [Bacteroides phage DAC23]
MIPNNKNIRVDIERVCNIFKKELKDVTESEWEELKVFKQKITISSAFAHKFCKKSNEIESRDLPNQ